MEVGTLPESMPNGAAAVMRAQEKASIDYDAFLQLLIAQLKNQDPTQPMDTAEYIGQLASFSNVEQAINTNAKLDALLAAQSLSQAGSMIGRTVTSEDGSVRGEVAAVRIISGGAVAVLADGQELLLGPGVIVT